MLRASVETRLRLLALETATEACSAALLVDGAVLERYEFAPRRHTALILPMVEALLAEAGLTLQQLDALAVGRGPGAFTGVRLAISVAQGLAFGADLPVAAVSSLAALAWAAVQETGETHIATALDARMGEVYWATWVQSGVGLTLQDAEQVCAPEAVTAAGGSWFGVGSGWLSYAPQLAPQVVNHGWLGERYPRAAAVAQLGAAQPALWVAAEQVLPVYVRDRVVTAK